MVDRGIPISFVRNRNCTLGFNNVQKQKQMKHLFYILLIALASCKDTTHEVRYSPDGSDSVVYVRYYDGQQFTSFYMAYPQFRVLYDSVGYEGCYEYARHHQLPVFWQRKYSKYKKLND